MNQIRFSACLFSSPASSALADECEEESGEEEGRNVLDARGGSNVPVAITAPARASCVSGFLSSCAALVAHHHPHSRPESKSCHTLALPPAPRGPAQHNDETIERTFTSGEACEAVEDEERGMRAMRVAVGGGGGEYWNACGRASSWRVRVSRWCRAAGGRAGDTERARVKSESKASGRRRNTQ